MGVQGSGKRASPNLRAALGAFATGVTIVTTRRKDDFDVGLTANSFNSVSLDPPMILWSLAKSSANIGVFREAAHFAVHILSAGQDELSGRFARKTDSEPGSKFDGLRLDRGSDGIPLLLDCAARFECRTEYQYAGGDHVIFVGRVLDFSHSDRPPLIFHGGRYGLVMRKDEMVEAASAESSLTPNDLIYLISRAFHRIRADAVAERRRRGWSEAEYAVLSVLGREDGQTREQIATTARFHDWTVTQASVESLARKGLVATDAGEASPIRLTNDGRMAIISLIAMLKSAEADALEDWDASEIQVLKGLLRRIAARE